MLYITNTLLTFIPILYYSKNPLSHLFVHMLMFFYIEIKCIIECYDCNTVVMYS